MEALRRRSREDSGVLHLPPFDVEWSPPTPSMMAADLAFLATLLPESPHLATAMTAAYLGRIDDLRKLQDRQSDLGDFRVRLPELQAAALGGQLEVVKFLMEEANIDAGGPLACPLAF
ncbi:uncharacterized protein DSM5745_04424 [Aspergillus mulundensis]|uniref:Ankyrin repeat protein n=1 Tax=Aspergillus mulundensis TaxID=1810919 RepID=A0A3D8SEB7_9EURO|nr:hypothetical protein DSM5745_04424 [Aspergillus mulundensis]RDW84098.1 hypothetical protein DSM5745_04424 [Aspergillus mulundensis]